MGGGGIMDNVVATPSTASSPFGRVVNVVIHVGVGRAVEKKTNAVSRGEVEEEREETE